MIVNIIWVFIAIAALLKRKRHEGRPAKKDLKLFLIKSRLIQPGFVHQRRPRFHPHRFTRKQDIEIAGFFAAIFPGANRATIINKSRELLNLMDNALYDFCLQHTATDLKNTGI